jgi:hypothetical protein
VGARVRYAGTLGFHTGWFVPTQRPG